MLDTRPIASHSQLRPSLRWLGSALFTGALLLAGCSGETNTDGAGDQHTPSPTLAASPTVATTPSAATGTATRRAPALGTTTPTTQTEPVRPTPKLAVTPQGSPPARAATGTPTAQPDWLPTVQAAQTATTLAENWCPPETASLLITWFVDAFNAGDRERLLDLLPDVTADGAPDVLDSDDDPTHFYQFVYLDAEADTAMIEPSVTPTAPITPDQHVVTDWLLARHAAGERWELAGIDVDEVRQREVLRIPAVSEATVGLRVTTTAGEREPWTMIGVVQVNCQAQIVIMWTMVENPLPEEWQ